MGPPLGQNRIVRLHSGSKQVSGGRGGLESHWFEVPIEGLTEVVVDPRHSVDRSREEAAILGRKITIVIPGNREFAVHSEIGADHGEVQITEEELEDEEENVGDLTHISSLLSRKEEVLMAQGGDLEGGSLAIDVRKLGGLEEATEHDAHLRPMRR